VWSRHGAGGRLERRAGAAPASMGAARSAPRRRAAARARVGGRLGSGRSAGVLAVHLGEKGEEREREEWKGREKSRGRRWLPGAAAGSQGESAR
jgi:hypothetical protein